MFVNKNTPKIEVLSSRAIQTGFLTSFRTNISFLSLEIAGEIFIRSHFNPGTQKVSLLFLEEQRAPLLNLNCLGSGDGGEKRWLERFLRFAVSPPSALHSGSAFSPRRRGSCVPEAGPEGNVTPGTAQPPWWWRAAPSWALLWVITCDGCSSDSSLGNKTKTQPQKLPERGIPL